jgi:hypothetical protein
MMSLYPSLLMSAVTFGAWTFKQPEPHVLFRLCVPVTVLFVKSQFVKAPVAELYHSNPACVFSIKRPIGCNTLAQPEEQVFDSTPLVTFPSPSKTQVES